MSVRDGLTLLSQLLDKSSGRSLAIHDVIDTRMDHYVPEWVNILRIWDVSNCACFNAVPGHPFAKSPFIRPKFEILGIAITYD